MYSIDVNSTLFRIKLNYLLLYTLYMYILQYSIEQLNEISEIFFASKVLYTVQCSELGRVGRPSRESTIM